MSPPVPTVEDRLHSSLMLCQVLKGCALLGTQDPRHPLPTLTPRDVLQLFPATLDALTDQITAVQAALSSTCRQTPAPLGGRVS